MELDGIWVQVLAAVIGVLGTAVLYTIKKGASWLEVKLAMNEAEKESMQCLLDGMSLAQETLVREAKQAAEDGKLTKDEIKKAEAIALEYAKDIATGPAKDIVVSWTERRVSALIKQLLAKMKGSN
ncbi:MAG: hypothetical protein D4S01_04380 [Dehalococcoidia bacterium]|nr:MAG: hypothetical protein D4S01_04380 [Dehalococcoidia bacterium]